MADQPIEMTAEAQIAAEAERTMLTRTLLEKSAAFAGTQPAVVARPEPKGGLADILAEFAKPGATAQKVSMAERAARVEEVLGPLVAEGKQLMAKHGAYSARHRDRVAAVAATDLTAVAMSVPYDFVFGRDAAVSPSRQALKDLEETSKSLLASLDARFTGGSRRPREVDEPDLGGCIREAGAILNSAGTLGFDERTNEVDAMTRRLASHLKFHVEIARQIVADVERLLARFDKVSSRVETLLAAATPKSVHMVTPVNAPPPPLPAEPAAMETTYTKTVPPGVNFPEGY